MPTVSDIPGSPGANSQMHATLTAGLKTLSGDQHITFNLYQRYVNPVDGMAYWIRVLAGSQSAVGRPSPGLTYTVSPAGESTQVVAGGLAAATILGGYIVNPENAEDQGLAEPEPLVVSVAGPTSTVAAGEAVALAPGQRFDIPPQPVNGVFINAVSGGHQCTVVTLDAVSLSSGAPLSIEQPGSLHYATEVEQEEDAVADTNRIIFTSPTEVEPFNLLGANELYIGQHGAVRFAFSSRAEFYEEANLFHYLGQSLDRVNLPLVIDNPIGWTPTQVISNSLPIWLALPGYVPPYPGFVCEIPLYPSFLVTSNLPPPFGAVHVDSTTPLSLAPIYGPRMQQDQLAKDVVRVTLYGVDNLKAQTFLAFIEQFSRDWNTLGMMSTPIVVDEKRIQPEFKILAQKKTIKYEVAYHQSAARDAARQLFEAAKIRWVANIGGGGALSGEIGASASNHAGL
jgi:hypothetical protein